MTNRRDEALAVVLQAEQQAPEQVHYHYLTRELVLSWMRERRSPEPGSHRSCSRAPRRVIATVQL